MDDSVTIVSFIKMIFELCFVGFVTKPIDIAFYSIEDKSNVLQMRCVI